MVFALFFRVVLRILRFLGFLRGELVFLEEGFEGQIWSCLNKTKCVVKARSTAMRALAYRLLRACSEGSAGWIEFELHGSL